MHIIPKTVSLIRSREGDETCIRWSANADDMLAAAIFLMIVLKHGIRNVRKIYPRVRFVLTELELVDLERGERDAGVY